MTDTIAERFQRALETFPPGQQEIAQSVADAVRFGWIAAQRIFGEHAVPHDGLEIASLILVALHDKTVAENGSDLNTLFKTLLEKAAAFGPEVLNALPYPPIRPE